MLLLTETVDFQQFEINESESKQLFIEGIFAQAEKKNRNGRIYPKNVMEGSVKTYNENFVLKNNALGELSRELGKRYSDYRKRMKYTQKEVAEKSGLSVFTISSFENGSSTGITLSSFIKLLRAIDSLEEVEKLLPELPKSPRTLFKKQSKK
jgi:DNA-binding XRE family transcriptional regulator